MNKYLFIIPLFAILLTACKKDNEEEVIETKISVDNITGLYGVDLATNINTYQGATHIGTLNNPDIDIFEYLNQEMMDQDIYKAILISRNDTILEIHLILEKDHCPVPITSKYNAFINHFKVKLSEEMLHTNQHPTNPTIGCHWLGAVNRLVISRYEEYSASICFVRGTDFLYAH